MMQMPFGKHRGKDMEELPRDYLEWLLEPVLSNGKEFNVSPAVQEEAQRILDKWDEMGVMDKSDIADDLDSIPW
jgi:hypothetical protein